MNSRNSTSPLVLPPPVRRFREHLREIRRVAGETQGQLLDARAALDHQIAHLDSVIREQASKLERIERRLGELDGAGQHPALGSRPAPFDYEAAVAALVSVGVPEETIRWGSIDRERLTNIRETIRRELRSDRPAVALHIGNFLGVSLVGVASAMCEVHPASLTIGIDPDAAIAGVAHPQEYVVALLDHFDLTRNVLLVCGYSFRRNTPDSTDIAPEWAFDTWLATVRGDATPPPQGEALSADGDAPPPPSGEDVLPMLARLGARYDIALVDGYHGADTVAAELRYLTSTLRVGGLVFLDDADDYYPGIRDLFRDPGERFEQLGHDGRVGVLKLVR